MYVARQIGVDPVQIRIDAYSKESCARHQRVILSYFGFAPFDKAASVFAAGEIANLVGVQFRPKLVLLEILQTLTRRKIEIPSYNILAGLIIAALNRHQRTLSQIIATGLSEQQRTKLDELLEKEPGEDTDPGWRYRLTLLKKPFQSTRPSKIKANLADLTTLQSLYLDLAPLVHRLHLSHEAIRYYAYFVIKAQIPQISRRADEDRFLHLVAFIVYQTFKLNDTLINTMLVAVQAAINGAEKDQKETYFEEREQRTRSFSALADQLHQDVEKTLASIRHILADTQLSDGDKVSLIDATLNGNVARPAAVEARIDEFKQSARQIQQGQDYLVLLENRSLKLQHRVADIVRQVRFAPNCGKPLLWNALRNYQQKDGNVDKSAPAEFLSADQRAGLTGTDGKFRVSLYKALLYVEIANGIKSGVLNLIHSEKYRALDEYLIPKAEWNEHRAEYLRRAQLDQFADCNITLRSLEQALEARYQQTNQNSPIRRKPTSDDPPKRQLPYPHAEARGGGSLVTGNFFPGA